MNEFIPLKEMTNRVHYMIFYNNTKIPTSPFFPITRITPFDYSSSIMRAVDEGLLFFFGFFLQSE